MRMIVYLTNSNALGAVMTRKYLVISPLILLEAFRTKNLSVIIEARTPGCSRWCYADL